jgi:hypothetical protein
MSLSSRTFSSLFSTSGLMNAAGWIFCSVADPDPVPFLPLDPGSGMDKKLDQGHISESFE